MNFSRLRGSGRSVDLLDNQLVLLGDDSPGKFGKLEYKGILNPRKGLLGMKFSEKALEESEFGQGFNSPRWHTTHVYGNQLLAIGGQFQTAAQFLHGIWKGALPHNRVGACKVRLQKDVFLLIGGVETPAPQWGVEVSTVLKLDITTETILELSPIRHSRAFHSCEVFDGQVLISGGKQGNNIITDEIFDLNTTHPIPLSPTSSIQRHRHQLLRLEDTIYSFGGLLADGSQTTKVEWFDWTSRRWRQHELSLLSSNVTSLAVVPFPRSAVDCNAGCSCGILGSSSANTGRIIGGWTAQVI